MSLKRVQVSTWRGLPKPQERALVAKDRFASPRVAFCMHLPRLLSSAGLLLAACGAPGTPATPTPPAVAPAISITAPASGMTVSYRACSDRGHASITLVAGRPPPVGWSVREANAEDLARDPTVEGRARLERPAFVARSGAATIVTTGMSRAELDRLIAGLGDATGAGDPARHHVIDTTHLHLPWPAVFDGMTARRDDEFYAARFSYYSVYGGMTSTPPITLAGATYRWSFGRQPTNDDGSGPLRPLWHGEAFQTVTAPVLTHDALLSNDATGDRVTDRSFLAFSEQALRATSAGPRATCRMRTGGPPYRLLPDDVQMVAGEIRFDDAGTRRTIRFEDDGSVREAGIPIGSMTANGMLFRYEHGGQRIVGQLHHRTGEILVNDRVVAVADPALAGVQYSGPAHGRIAAALALWIARH